MERVTALVPRIDGNLFEFYEHAASAAGKPCVRGNGYRHMSLKPSPWASLVFDLNLEAESDFKELARAVAEGSLPNRVAVGPTSSPPDIGARLLAAGFENGRAQRGMVLDMARRLHPAAPAGLAVSPLAQAAQFEAFAAIVVEGLFGAGPETASAFAALLRALDGARAFGVVGSFEGEPVSAAYAFIDGEGGGGVYFVATKESRRGRGFGSATVSAILDELERRGARNCILQATESGKPVYEGLGFEDACGLGRYALPAEKCGRADTGER
jgi:GNAT superfamily N-acetyltransferase